MDDEDRPPIEVIDDDAELDRYLDDLVKRRRQERQKARRS